MPTVAIKEITEEQDIDVYSHEVGFDLNDHSHDVLEAVEFEHSKDALDYILEKDNVDLDSLVRDIEERGGLASRGLSLYTTDKLFQEIMRRSIGELI